MLDTSRLGPDSVSGPIANLGSHRAAYASCEGHVQTPDDDYARLLTRYGSDSVGFVAELAKKNSERKLLHQVLSAAGIPSETHEGRGLCLLARFAIMAERLANAEAIAALECGCRHPYHADRQCTGTLGSVSDSDWVEATIRTEGRVASEPCACHEYVAQ